MPLRLPYSLKGRTMFQLQNLPCLALFVKSDHGLGSVSILQTQQLHSCPGLSAASSITATALSKNHLVFCRVRRFPFSMGNSDCLSHVCFCNVPLLCITLTSFFHSLKESLTFYEFLWISPKFKSGMKKVRPIKKTEKKMPWETFWWHILLVQHKSLQKEKKGTPAAYFLNFNTW